MEGRNETMNSEEMKKKLFHSAMKGEWKEVATIYREYADEALTTKITQTGETALHIAVSDGQEDIVEELLKMFGEDPAKVLEIRNDRGNTPLHYAAAVGSVAMCVCIARRAPQLIGVRNVDGETPLFLAALHGKKEAFLCLHDLRGDVKDYSYCRRRDGQTILHSAIYGDYYDLALQIISLYEELVYCVNEQGFSPLHLLATKPSAFKSGSSLRSTSSVLYHCIFVDELTTSDYEIANQEVKKSDCPDNYKTFVLFFKLIKHAVQIATTGRKARKPQEIPIAPEKPEIKIDQPQDPARQPSSAKAQGHELFPSTYMTLFSFIKYLSKAALVVLGRGSTSINKIRQKKEKNTWSVQIMNELLDREIFYEYNDNGVNRPAGTQLDEDEESFPYRIIEGGDVTFCDRDIEPDSSGAKPSDVLKQLSADNEKSSYNIKDLSKGETPILTAAKNGITEMVECILERLPGAIHDMNSDLKNIVLLAVENRQPHVYALLLKRNILIDNIFRKVDRDGNSALHLAATLGDYKPWLIPGAALQMQWEIKWFEFVKSSMPPHFFNRYNKAGKTASSIFSETHKDLVKSGGEWLTNTSESCSVVAALIATVAFATSTTVPGGVKEGIGTPTLENHPAFDAFAISSLIALCFSVTAVVLFLSILTSRYQERDFQRDLPRKLLLGLSSLFVSIAAMLVSFCAGHFFVLKDKLKYAVLPVYAITCLPITLFAIAQFPLYFDLVWATYKKVPQRSYK